jgi:hypothetical protein
MTTGSGTIAAIGTMKGLFFVEDGELRGPYFADERVPAVSVTPEGRVIVASVSMHWGPTVRRSEDFGRTWTEHDERVIAFPEGLEWTDLWANKTQPAAVVQVWQIVDTGPQGDDVVYAGTEPAALFKSTDGGRSFELMRSLWDHPHRAQWYPGGGGLGLHTILIDPRDRDRLHVAISTGGVYRSDDGGKSWEPRNKGISSPGGPDPYPEYGQCVHKIGRDAENPDVLYAQNHGGLYRTDDRGDQWIDIANDVPSDFGFPLVVHPRKGRTAYVIPLSFEQGRVVPDAKPKVWRTTDGGESWQALSKGLPERAYLTVLRDAFCHDGADPLGLWWGSRTGHVFHSADEGETWRTAAEALPDVLVVRAVVPA